MQRKIGSRKISFHHLRFMQKLLSEFGQVNTGETDIFIHKLLQNRNLEVKADQVPGHAIDIQPLIKPADSLHVEIICQQCRRFIRSNSVMFKRDITFKIFLIG